MKKVYHIEDLQIHAGTATVDLTVTVTANVTDRYLVRCNAAQDGRCSMNTCVGYHSHNHGEGKHGLCDCEEFRCKAVQGNVRCVPVEVKCQTEP